MKLSNSVLISILNLVIHANQGNPVEANLYVSLPLTPACAKVAMPLWQAAAALSSGTASAAAVASPSRMSMSSNGRWPIA